MKVKLGAELQLLLYPDALASPLLDAHDPRVANLSREERKALRVFMLAQRHQWWSEASTVISDRLFTALLYWIFQKYGVNPDSREDVISFLKRPDIGDLCEAYAAPWQREFAVELGRDLLKQLDEKWLQAREDALQRWLAQN